MIQVSAKAPGFSCVDGDSKPVSLSQFAGRKLAIYFYPRDDTPGCTLEACNLRDHWELLEGKGISVLGVSTDGADSHKSFATKYDLPFRLLADADGKIGTAYGVSAGRLHKRATFLVDEAGIVKAVIESVNVHDHASQILAGFGLK